MVISVVFAAQIIGEWNKKFYKVQYYLIHYEHNNLDHCPDSEIILHCTLHGYICGVLGILISLEINVVSQSRSIMIRQNST